MELDHVLSSRDTINAKLREILDEATHKWGAKVSRVELKDINPPRDIRDAMEKQMRAERDRRAAILTDRKSTRLNSSHGYISYAVFCLKKKKTVERNNSNASES